MNGQRVIRIGGASGFWGETMMATPQLLKAGGLDYIVYDYLAEITMSILARQRADDPAMGYAHDFVSVVMRQNLKEIARQGVRIISNAGGTNPTACAAALRRVIADQGLALKVAVVAGDDLLDRAAEFAGSAEMFSGQPFPDPASIASINAYLGAFPIAAALSAGADIVITGRVVDSAVTLGACIHEFGWAPDDWDWLAAGTLAGHILECGPQATGGNFTDWHLVAERLAEIGYPIGEISADGTFVVTKPAGSGGIVNAGTVAEQMLYEIGDPQAYAVPDVLCDFSEVAIREIGADRVQVSGARGRPAPAQLKVCATYADGFRGGAMLQFIGLDAAAKARAFAQAAVTRARAALRQTNAADFTETSIEVIGAGSQYGAAGAPEAREVVVKIAARHPEQKGVGALLREITGLGLTTPAGMSAFAGTRPKPSPVVRLFSFLIDRDRVPVAVEVEGQPVPFAATLAPAGAAPALARPPEPPAPDLGPDPVSVPLVRLAWGRSGDKGDKGNIGIIARDPAFLPYLWAALTPDVVAGRFAHFLEGGRVERFLLPGPPAINFLLHDVLGGGGVASLRADPQAKAYAQVLLDHPIPVPAALARRLAAAA